MALAFVDSDVSHPQKSRQMSELEQQQTTQEQQTEAPEASALDESQGSKAPEQQTEATEDVETLKKRLADTQAWAHQRNQRAIELERQQEAFRLKQLQDGLQPEVLNVVDQAIEAREIRARQEQSKREAMATQAIYEFDPSVEALQGNPEFVQAFSEQCDKLREQGKDPLNPVYAVKAVAEARKQFDSSQQRAQAQAQEQARKTSKLSAMDVPGSGAAATQSKGKSEQDLAADVWNMSPEDFAKMKMKARGF